MYVAFCLQPKRHFRYGYKCKNGVQNRRIRFVCRSPVETFFLVLDHLRSKIYTSSRLSRYISIRKSIDSLVEARDRLPPFCTDLHQKTDRILSNSISAEERRGSLVSAEIPSVPFHGHIPTNWQTPILTIYSCREPLWSMLCLFWRLSTVRESANIYLY